MTNQHRATPEQWAYMEANAWPQMTACLLELRARIEQLEAAANDRQQDEDAERAAEPAPTDSLVQQVAEAIFTAEGDGNTEDWRPEARAAIREVAAWLRSVVNNGSAEELEREADR
jgi:hypothetical protein